MFFLDISKSFTEPPVDVIYGAVRSILPFLLWLLRVYVYFLLASSDGKNELLATV